MSCLDKLNNRQKNEITQLLTDSSARRIETLIRHYGLCEVCALHIYTSAILTIFHLREGSTLKPDDAIQAVMRAVEKTWDVTVVSAADLEELAKELHKVINTASTVQTAAKKKMH